MKIKKLIKFCELYERSFIHAVNSGDIPPSDWRKLVRVTEALRAFAAVRKAVRRDRVSEIPGIIEAFDDRERYPAKVLAHGN